MASAQMVILARSSEAIFFTKKSEYIKEMLTISIAMMNSSSFHLCFLENMFNGYSFKNVIYLIIVFIV